MGLWKATLAGLVIMLGCSDIGTGPSAGSAVYDLQWAGWNEYDLPYAQIYLPSGFVQRTSVAALPENPEYAGAIDNQRIQVQFCLYLEPLESSYREYQEQTITLSGKRAVQFRGIGLFHLYDSHFSTIVGVRAYFNPAGGSIAVIVAVTSASENELAERILMSVHPQPRNTGLPL